MTHYHGGTDWQEGGGPEPSEHLDQCPCAAVGVPSCICDDNEECGPQCRHNCICDRLRACEQRKDREWMERMTRQDQYAAGVQAAREAVAQWTDKRKSHDFRTCNDYDHDCYLVRGALAAIDGILKGEQA